MVDELRLVSSLVCFCPSAGPEAYPSVRRSIASAWHSYLIYPDMSDAVLREGYLEHTFEYFIRFIPVSASKFDTFENARTVKVGMVKVSS